MIMWIVLGVLVAGVVIFLIVTTTLDRKKRKKEKHQIVLREEAANDAIGQVAIWTNLVIAQNSQALKTFVPSIGHLKMSDINNLAKDQLKLIKKSALFKKLFGDEELAISFENNIGALIKIKSNNWSKQGKDFIDFFNERENSLSEEDKEKLKEFKEKTNKRLEKLYSKKKNKL